MFGRVLVYALYSVGRVWFLSVSHLEGKVDFLVFIVLFQYKYSIAVKLCIFCSLQLPHVFVNCVEHFTSRLLLEEILIQLQNHSSETKEAAHVPCDTFNDFVRLFKQAIVSQDLQDETFYIVSNLILVCRFHFSCEGVTNCQSFVCIRSVFTEFLCGFC